MTARPNTAAAAPPIAAGMIAELAALGLAVEVEEEPPLVAEAPGEVVAAAVTAPPVPVRPRAESSARPELRADSKMDE